MERREMSDLRKRAQGMLLHEVGLDIIHYPVDPVHIFIPRSLLDIHG
jgi:hypothetical protein